jgi:hypothetical protein
MTFATRRRRVRSDARLQARGSDLTGQEVMLMVGGFQWSGDVASALGA